MEPSAQLEARLGLGPDPRTTSTWHSSWTLYLENAPCTIWGLLDPNLLSMALRAEQKCSCASPEGFRGPRCRLPPEGNESGCEPAMRASFRPGTYTGPPRRSHRGQNEGHSQPPLPHWFLQALCLQQPPSCRRGSNQGRPALHTTQQDLSAHTTSKNILQKRKLRLEMALGQGSTPSLRLRNSRETKSPAGLGAKCLLCRITSTG